MIVKYWQVLGKWGEDPDIQQLFSKCILCMNNLSVFVSEVYIVKAPQVVLLRNTGHNILYSENKI